MKNTIKLSVTIMSIILSMVIDAQTLSTSILYENIDTEVKAEITITDSKTIEGYKNLDFKLSNGMSFTYEDGNTKAGYNNRTLDVKGKYSITSEVGTLSLAFNADDGSIWWIFKVNK